ncbi:hypothetical protein DWU98_21360 [Dyella monticola]|uniref:Uncharacterized protein n=1 Tax=Dyella monticola TaxID=1927958 RepID=A0A370WRV9_9GAMM|nr:hypothetical protein [Dyella monticola]RDS78736.1 hypothetical protein DWU98_21360 [Dyella monticola]
MPSLLCWHSLCVFPLPKDGEKIFGFPEFLAALALMVLAWTVGDIQYRFRGRIAPVPLPPLTFYSITTIGVLTLLTDLWRAEGWLVLDTGPFSPLTWQAFLGSGFLITFLTWGWYAFINPPIFSEKNAKRYGQLLYSVILKGSPTEVPVIASELADSAHEIVSRSWLIPELENKELISSEKKFRFDPFGWKRKRYFLSKDVAYDILLLIADRKFCRYVVQSSQYTALEIFGAMTKMEKYQLPVGPFARNITEEAIQNKDSFVFHESSGYQSGLLGFHKPLTQTLYGNYRMVKEVEDFFDVDYMETQKWDPDQWEAYGRLVLVSFRDYAKKELGQHAPVFWRSFECILRSAYDLYEVNRLERNYWDTPQCKRLDKVCHFFKEAIDILAKYPVPNRVHLREKLRQQRTSIYDLIAREIAELVFYAGQVAEPRELCWSVQHSTVWFQVFESFDQDTAARKFIRHKVRRALWDEIERMTSSPNFKGARMIAFLLNVLGFVAQNDDRHRDWVALHKVLLEWLKKNYAKLYIYNPSVAAACLVAGYTYDQAENQLIFTAPAEGLRRVPYTNALPLGPADESKIPGQ